MVEVGEAPARAREAEGPPANPFFRVSFRVDAGDFFRRAAWGVLRRADGEDLRLEVED